MKDEWLRAALTDDSMVVELLLRLKQSSSSYASMPTTSSKPPPVPVPVPLCWGQRLPRSKLANTVARKDSTTTTTRCSPTTPLSWSDGGCDESSVSRAPSDLSSASRSKGIIGTSDANTSRMKNRSTRKRKFANLKERESILLKERIHLNRELASLQVTFKEQKAMSENFKRFKFDLNGGESRETIAAAAQVSTANHCQPPLMPIQHHHIMKDDDDDGALLCNSEVETNDKRGFVLPDLNMMPTEEEIAG